VLLVDDNGVWHLFYASSSDLLNPTADTLVHWYRPVT
jgi:hypothetical protein